MTYNQESPLTLPDDTVISAGMLKPLWNYVEKELNSKFVDVTVQDIKATDMIQTESTSNFTGANIFGGNSIADRSGAVQHIIVDTMPVQHMLVPCVHGHIHMLLIEYGIIFLRKNRHCRQQSDKHQ